MGAAGSKFHHIAPAPGFHHARGFGGDERLKRDRGEQIRLGNLRLDQWRSHGEHGLAREQRRAFRGGKKITSETKITKVIEELGRDLGELGKSAQVCDLL